MAETQQGWVRGSGARKRSLDGKFGLPPLWGVYNPRCSVRDTPHVVIVVVEYYCFLKRIIDVGAVQVADVSLGLFCIYLKNGRFV